MKHYPSVEETKAANAAVDAHLATLDQRLVATTTPRPATETTQTIDEVVSDETCFKTYDRLRKENPFYAAQYRRMHESAIYRALATRTPEDLFPRAIQPRRPVRII